MVDFARVMGVDGVGAGWGPGWNTLRHCLGGCMNDSKCVGTHMINHSPSDWVWGQEQEQEQVQNVVVGQVVVHHGHNDNVAIVISHSVGCASLCVC